MSRAFVEGTFPSARESANLADTDIHIWLGSATTLGRDVIDGLRETLDRGELVRAGRYVLKADRDSFIVRHGMLRAALGYYLDIHPREVRLELEENRQPLVLGSAQIHVSVSHSHGVSAAAVCKSTPVGIDIERVRPIPEAAEISRQLFHTRQATILQEKAGQSRDEFFLKCWTCMEATLKACGVGLVGLENEDLDLDGYGCHSFIPCDGYLGAVASARQGAVLQFVFGN
jgi:4'-phosphopantetheinyl transferase